MDGTPESVRRKLQEFANAGGTVARVDLRRLRSVAARITPRPMGPLTHTQSKRRWYVESALDGSVHPPQHVTVALDSRALVIGTVVWGRSGIGELGSLGELPGTGTALFVAVARHIARDGGGLGLTSTPYSAPFYDKLGLVKRPLDQYGRDRTWTHGEVRRFVNALG